MTVSPTARRTASGQSFPAGRAAPVCSSGAWTDVRWPGARSTAAGLAYSRRRDGHFAAPPLYIYQVFQHG